MKHFYYISIFVCISTFSNLCAQKTISSTILDSISQNPIPYVSITFNDFYGVMSNETGKFTMNLENKITNKDSIFISCLGYNSKSISAKNFSETTIILHPKTIELNEITVTNRNYTAKEIIEKIKENLNSNYERVYSKKTLFYRESYKTSINKSDIYLKKSTIPEFNQNFIDSLLQAIPKKSDSYTELLGDLYGNNNVDQSHKLNIIKASKLYDKNNEISFNAFEERINSVIKKRVKRDSYFKLKSGIFSTKEEIDSTFYNDSEANEVKELVEEQKKRELEKNKNFLKYRKRSITKLEQNSFVFEDSELNFLEKSKKYKFELLDYAFLNNNYVYKINFTPNGSADYKGTLYVNPLDFAIERVDYENVKPLKKFGLLGISFQHYLQKGTLIYSINDIGKYELKFAELQNAENFGIKRPFKIIEKNKHVKGKSKQNELSGKVHFIVSNVSKVELVIFKNSHISESIYSEFTEKSTVAPTYLPKYDPEFWKGHNVIEPNQAIKDFKSIE